MTEPEWPYERLINYKPELTAREDFAAFWAGLISISAATALNATVTEHEYVYNDVVVYDVEYDGVDGARVHGWYLLPRQKGVEPLPVLVRFHGYTSTDRIHPYQLMYWSALGVAVLSIEIRGQAGITPDPTSYHDGNVAGWVTKGILSPHTYYYKHVYLDCLRAIDFVCSREEIDSARIAVHGESQGGGLALAVAALDSRPKLLLSVFPFFCHVERSIEVQVLSPYGEIIDWFRQFDATHEKRHQVYETVSYFDVMNMAPLVGARTFMGIALQDTCCPPSASFAAYNHVASDKELVVLPDYGHVGGIAQFQESMMRFLKRYL